MQFFNTQFIKTVWCAALVLAGLSATPAVAQTTGELEARIINEGQWTLAFKMRPGLLGVNGLDVMYDTRTLIGLGNSTYAVNLSKVVTTPKLFQQFPIGTYKIDCNNSEFYFIGYKFLDGSWIAGQPGYVVKFDKQNRVFFGNFCSQADSLLAAREAARVAAIKAAEPAPAPVKLDEPTEAKVAPLSSKRTPQPAPTAKPKLPPAPLPEPPPQNEKVYSSSGLTFRCATEQGRRVCR